MAQVLRDTGGRTGAEAWNHCTVDSAVLALEACQYWGREGGGGY